MIRITRNIIFIFFLSFPSFAKIGINKKDVSLATNIKQVYRLTSKGKLNKKLILKLNKQVGKRKLFKEFRFWSNDLISLSSKIKHYQVKNLCDKITARKHNDELKKSLNKNLIELCFNKYLKSLSKNHKNNLRFHKRETKYIKFNTNYILSSFNQSELEFLLSRFKNGSQKHSLYSKTFMDYYKVTRKVPNKELIKYLALTPNDTKYLQSIDLEKYNTQYVFYKELSKLKKMAFEKVDESQNKAEIITAFNNVYNYFVSTYENQPKAKATLTLQSISKSYMRRGFYTEARKGFSKILSNKDHRYTKVLFDHIWSYILEENFHGAAQVFRTYNIDENFLKENPKTHFWLAHIYKKLERKEKAKVAYEKIIKDNPLSFYAIQSSKLLGRKINQTPNDVYKSYISNESRQISSTDKVHTQTIKKILTWAKVHQLNFMNLELNKLKTIEDEGIRQKNLTKVARTLSEHNEYLKSFQIIYKSLDDDLISLSKEHLDILFPRPYFGQIKQSSRQFDPIIALSLIRQESGFNEKARSHVGARGLMQLMPTTARQLKRRVKTRHLYNPRLNIKLGTKFFGQLFEHYDENLVYSLAAYNAGRRRVDEWQSSYLNKESILENIENIPFTETRKYVKLIFRNIFFYKLLHEEQNKSTNSLNQIYDIKLGFVR